MKAPNANLQSWALEMRLIRELQIAQEVTNSADLWRRVSENAGYFLRNIAIDYKPHIQKGSVRWVDVVHEINLNETQKKQLKYFEILLNYVFRYRKRYEHKLP